VDYNEYVDIQTLRQVKDNFVSVLQKATEGEQTSLPFIRHHFRPVSLMQSGDMFQALVIGGSVCQKATMKKVGDQVQILEHSREQQPPFHTKADLMAFLETQIHPKVEVIALNFAYPLTPILRNSMPDGILQSGTKENVFDGLVGTQVGEAIETYMKQVHGRTIRVAVANDVICLLLSGFVSHEWDAIAAGIVGTGMNFAIFLNRNTMVDLESANFIDFPQSEAGKEIDMHSVSPGVALYEKEVSGAYLYQHFNILAKKRDILFQTIDSSEQLNFLVRHEMPEVVELARKVLDHSASLVSTQIAGILEFSKRDLTFIMQGSLFWGGHGYKERIEDLVAELVPDYSASYEQILHSDIIGASKLVDHSVHGM
jgi:hexokinase